MRRGPAFLIVAAFLASGLAGLSFAETAEAAPPTLIKFGPPWGPAQSFGQVGEPAFTEYKAPSTLDGYNESGGPTIGISWKTDNVMYKANRNVYRVVFKDDENPPFPVWTDVTPFPETVSTELGGFLHTDPVTGRTWAGNVAGPCSLMRFSDDDGQHWTPMADPCAVSLGNASIASGPFALAGTPAYPHAVYYCGQGMDPRHTADNDMSCSFSDDGGVTFAPAVPVDPLGPCIGGVGHGKVGPDGTLFLTNHNCGAANASLIVSEDGGLTWAFRALPCAAPADCDRGSFQPSVGIGTNGTIYVAHAEENGIYVAKSFDKGVTWETLGQNNSMSGSAPPGWSGSYIDLGQVFISPPCQDLVACPLIPGGIPWAGYPGDPPVIEAEFANVVVGDDDRAAVTFLGSTRPGVYMPGTPSHENLCSSFADIHEWHYYLAMTFDGGANWTVKRLTPADDPVQIGGIWDRGMLHEASADLTPDCRNLREHNDLDLDSEGRIHLAFADGCLPAAPGGCTNGKTSDRAVATLYRQSTGCGLLGAFDTPFPYACDYYMEDGWIGDPTPVERFGGFGQIDITAPAPMTAYRSFDSVVVEGTVTRDWMLSDLAVDFTEPDEVLKGVRTKVEAEVIGGSGLYACLWASEDAVHIDDSLNCAGTGLFVNQTGTVELDFYAFDIRDRTRSLHEVVTLEAKPEPGTEDCRSGMRLIDPEFDVAPFMYVAGERLPQGSDHDIRAVCILPQAGGQVDVVLRLAELNSTRAGTMLLDDTRDAFYGVAFCLDNNPNEVCYAGVSETDASGDRAFRVGAIAKSDMANPAMAGWDNVLCPVSSPPLGPSNPGMIDVEAATVTFTFDRGALDLTNPPAGGAAGCGTIVRGGAPAVDGTTVTALGAGTALVKSDPYVTGAQVLVPESADTTDPSTGYQLDFRFDPPTLEFLEVDIGGVYEAAVNELITVKPDFVGGSGVTKCSWEWIDATGKPSQNPVDIENEKNEASLLSPKGSAKAVMQKSCSPYQLSFEKAGTYVWGLTAEDVLKVGTKSKVVSTARDLTLFVIHGEEGDWGERVNLALDGDTDLVEYVLKDTESLPVDTRKQPTADWTFSFDLNMVDEEGNLRFAMTSPPFVHTITAKWYDDNGTFIDEDQVDFTIVMPQSRDTVPDPPEVLPLPMSGVDQPTAELNRDGDSFYDRLDLCPLVPSSNKDRDGDGVGDECDDDLDGDGVRNAQDNCRFTPNPLQADTDLDGMGDACEGDSDGDGVADGRDNCPDERNPAGLGGVQADLDKDGIGDVCDVDIDGDGVVNELDACPRDPMGTRDTDGDGICDYADDDADGDGFLNDVERAAGSDPLNGLSLPKEQTDPAPAQDIQIANVRTSLGLMIGLLVVAVIASVVLALFWMPRRRK